MQEVACLGEKRVFEFNYDELLYGDEVLLHDSAVQFYGHNQEVLISISDISLFIYRRGSIPIK